MQNKAKKILYCRSCKSKSLTGLFSLGSLAQCGIFPQKKNQIVKKYILSLVLCKNCFLVQLDRNSNISEMFGNEYGYRSALNKSMIIHLKSKSKYLKKYLNKKKNLTIMDIGANDGTFLSNFYGERNINLYAIDPIMNKWKKFYPKNVNKINDFFPTKKINSKIKADLITSIACYYDLPDPLLFAKNVKDHLLQQGVWHIELSYLPLMLKQNSYDTICHEHLEYYSALSLSYIFKKSELKVIDVNFNDANGGSIALDIARSDSNYKISKKFDNLIKKEKKLGIQKFTIYKKFFDSIKTQ